MYPVGSIYITTTATCPLSSLFGTWSKVSSGRVLQGCNNGETPGTTKEAGLPNIKGSINVSEPWTSSNSNGALSLTSVHGDNVNGNSSQDRGTVITFDASKSNAIYGKSDTVQPPAYLVNIFIRQS